MKKKEEKPKARKILCGLHYDDGRIGFEDIYYHGMFDALEDYESRPLREDPEFCHAVGDNEHPDLLVTDDSDCLSDRLTSEWGEAPGVWQVAAQAVYEAIEMMASPDCRITEMKISGSEFVPGEKSYILLSVYTKELVYDKRTQKYLNKYIKKELKK